MTARLLLALLCFTAITAERATAQDAVLPRSDGQSGLCAPFGCETRIQQVFDAAHHPHAGRRQTPGARVGRNRDGFTTAQRVLFAHLSMVWPKKSAIGSFQSASDEMAHGGDHIFRQA